MHNAKLPLTERKFFSGATNYHKSLNKKQERYFLAESEVAPLITAYVQPRRQKFREIGLQVRDVCWGANRINAKIPNVKTSAHLRR